jgi:3D (Asp-Asp-Asp) domain-containing protein
MIALFIALTAWWSASSTSFCLDHNMADGTRTRERSAAHKTLPLGTKIKLDRPGPGGVQIWYVRDRIGSGSELDLWTDSCSDARAWGRRKIRFRIIGR